MSSKTPKKNASQAKDIRTFFANPNARKTPAESAPGSSKTTTDTKRKTEDSSQKRQRASAIAISDDEEEPIPKKRPSKLPKAVVISSDEDEPQPKKAAPKRLSATTATKRKKPALLISSDDEEEERPKKKATSTKLEKATPSKSAQKATATPKPKGNKPSSVASGEDDEDLVGPSKGKKPAPKAKTAPPKAEKEDGEGTKKKFKYAYYAHKAAAAADTSSYGSKEIPDGAPMCLSGLAFVFTGELPSFSRDTAVEAAKRFGGRVVGQPSSKTDFVVLGQDAGPKKLEAIKKHGVKTLDEDAFLKLIATRKGAELDEKAKKKLAKEEEAIQAAVKEMEKREKAEAKAARASKSSASANAVDPSTQLWTARYAPQSLKDICGNKSQVDKLQLWLEDWPKNLKSQFKKPGKSLTGTYRAVLITGSPGIGKTTSAHLCAKLAGYTPIELNASDTRSKKLVESGMNINNTSLDGFFSGGTKNSLGVDITDKTCLIMDEVDGMSAGDRGGVGALNALIKKTQARLAPPLHIPIICIANDRNAQKLKPLQATTLDMRFAKPQAAQIRSRIMTIAFKEKMKIPPNVIDQLVAGAQSDIRQVLNMLSTWKLSNNTMSFDDGKVITKMNEKQQILSPFDITSTILGPRMFSAVERRPLNDKMELYFQDHSFVPLFMQENYLKGHPAQLKNHAGPELAMKHLQLMDKAASSISDGDLVDRMIHGPEQHWSLMPLHAICSTVRPASLMYGQAPHWGNGLAFPSWLGQNSKQNKLMRQLSDVQIKMRMKVSGDKNEIRQQYIPSLFPHLVQQLVDGGTDAVEDVIGVMDQYYLGREDWDSIVELGVGLHKDDIVLKGIPANVKSAFTRKCNAGDHPIAYHKSESLGKVPKKLASAGEKPDLEDAFDMDDEVEVSDDEKEKANSDDIEGDSLIKKPKKKAVKPKK
ncbi:DNA replication factor C, large subunit [Cylindrobasidium torrendii FP15055 ss-10]|uniref:Replication factor C subunit 1 n=1 Tax=Cylindrobasidium torrendii FP15055 ss-10 TaxID=1314674 RepID=A0A0D7BGR6_9AGAR|nr:DNA replication factor C, large subunit [Cylindrobasidium torrendii FP15055 ss-10]